jgi:zinc carboxypeptidase
LPPAAPLNRAVAGAFHYHTYSYPGDAVAGPFALGAGPLPAAMPLYSLVEDLNGLAAWGNFTGVPNLAVNTIALHPGIVGGAQTLGGRDTIMLSMGPAPGVVNAPAVVITGGVHAREWIAVEFVYLLAEYLVRHYTNIPVTGYQRMIKSLVDSRRIYIIPMLNPDGNRQTVYGIGPVTRMWRKNRHVLPVTPAAWVNLLTIGLPPGNNNPPPFQNVANPGGGLDATYDVPNYDPANGIPPAPVPPLGLVNQDLANNEVGVDPNRNCTTPAWGYDGQRYPPGLPPVPSGASDPTLDPYFGPAVASEVETRNLQLALAHAAAAPGISVSIDYHAYGQQILYPSETAYNGAVGPDYTVLGMTLRQLVHTQGALDYRLGTPRQIINADATATIIDRAAQAHQSRAFAIELDPFVAPGVPLVAAGFQLNENQIMTVFEKNIRGALAALAAPGRPANWFTAYFQAFPMAWNMLQFMTWNPYGRGNQLPL